MSIPRRIIQLSLSAGGGKARELSPLERAAVTNIRLLHPDWEYILFDDARAGDLVASYCPEYEPVLRAFRYPIQRCDFVRNLAIYFLGGFYFDLDVLLSRPIDPLLSHAAVFPFEQITLNRFLRSLGMDWDVGNYGFGAAARNPFLQAVIENCVLAQRQPVWAQPMIRGARSLLTEYNYVLNTTGPGLVSRTFAERPDLAREVNILFPQDVLERATWHLFGDYGIHLLHSSWRGGGKSLWRRLGYRWDAFSYSRLMPESIRLGPTRTAIASPASTNAQMI